MKLKIRNIILIILHILASALLFLPMYEHVIYKRQNAQSWEGRQLFSFSFFDLTGSFVFSEWSELLAIAICILFSVVLISLFLQLVGKNITQQNSLFSLILTIINLAAFFLYSYFLKETERFVNESTMNVFKWGEMFGFELLVQIILVVIFLITYIIVKRNNLDKRNVKST